MTIVIDDTVVLTDKEAWTTALRDIRRSGVRVRQNVVKCCRSCIMPEDLGFTAEDEVPYGFTYGSQGFGYHWVNGVMVERKPDNRFRRNVRVESVFFNWGNGAGAVIAEVFEAYGFPVEWDGSEASCVVVTPTRN